MGDVLRVGALGAAEQVGTEQGLEEILVGALLADPLEQFGGAHGRADLAAGRRVGGSAVGLAQGLGMQALGLHPLAPAVEASAHHPRAAALARRRVVEVDNRQPDRPQGEQAAGLVEREAGPLTGLGDENVGAGQAGLGPGPAAFAVEDEGELVALAGEGEAHPLRAVGVEEPGRRGGDDFLQLTGLQPGDLLAGGPPGRRGALRQEDDRAGTVAAERGDQPVAVGGVEPQLGGDPLAPRAGGQQPLHVGAHLLVRERLGAEGQRAAQPGRAVAIAVAGGHKGLLGVGELVPAPRGAQAPDLLPAQIDVKRQYRKRT
jgi:hypothetical protein